jgi:hypothetical protein
VDDVAVTPVDPVDPVDPVPPPAVGTAGIRGNVWAPGNGLGEVPDGQEIAVDGALVYLSTTPPEPIPQQVYCAACQVPPFGAVATDARGRFELRGYPPGTYWLVIEKGQFRVEQRVELFEDTMQLLPPEMTTLPSRNAPSEGLYTPRIALAVGASDQLEDIMGKMGLGEVGPNGRYIPESSRGVLDIYQNGGSDNGVAIGTLEELVRDPARLAQYHILFIPCSGDTYARALRDQTVLRNIRNYVASGGNLYVTDWSGEWNDNVFPAQIQLGSGAFSFGSRIDTPANAYNAATDTWNTSLFGNADGSSYTSDNAEVADAAMRAWLQGQQGPVPGSATQTTYDAGRLRIVGNWNYIEAVHDVVIGQDPLGADIVDSPRVWVIGGRPGAATPKRPMTVSHEPVGCGRVLYSTYHTTDDLHQGLVPQERILLYLIMEIGTCRNPKQ